MCVCMCVCVFMCIFNLPERDIKLIIMIIILTWIITLEMIDWFSGITSYNIMPICFKVLLDIGG